jgi:23S rRNA-intervening sequence protein
MKDFRQLKVWEKAHALTLAVYRTTVAFPREEVYGITSQMAEVQRVGRSKPSRRMRPHRGWRFPSLP